MCWTAVQHVQVPGQLVSGLWLLQRRACPAAQHVCQADVFQMHDKLVE